ncbi:MAG: hypothetical protein ACKO2G_15280 [Verrucomicrobiales bacterium]
MNQQTLRALMLDRELGELTPEAALLLNAYLSEHPEWKSESRETTDLLRLASESTRRFPERGHAASAPASSWNRASTRLLAMAAGVVLFAGLAITFAYRVGREHAIAAERPASPSSSPQLASTSPQTALPWARYQLQPTHDGYTVVPLLNSNPIQKP